MKLGSIRYLIKEGFKGTWANRLMSLASIGVLVACMVVIGLAILISKNVNLAIGKLEQQNVIHVYLKDYAWAELSDPEELEISKDEEADEEDTEVGDESEESDSESNADASENVNDEQDGEENTIPESAYLIHNEEEAQDVCEKIAKLDNVKEAVFVSSEQGLEEATENIDMNFHSYLYDENPISMSITVTMKDMTYFDETVQQIREMEEVSDIQAYDGVANKINTIKQGISVAGFWIIGILIVISLVIVSNTIRVTMYNRKLEISIMKAVGATDAFVRIPFIIEGMLIGLTSALISEGIIYFCYRVATEKITEMFGQVVPFGDVAFYLMLVFAGIGVLAGMIGSFIMIGKYLRHEGSEFTAI